MYRNHPSIQAALSHRTKPLSPFWFTDPSARIQVDTYLLGRRVMVVDAEDAFTEMLAQQLSSLGLLVTINQYDKADVLEGSWDLTVMGPGPGNPLDLSDYRINCMRDSVVNLLASKRPFLAVCLSHQILCHEYGLGLSRKEKVNQGVQQEIDFYGTKELVGFYNTYAATCDDTQEKFLNKMNVAVCRDKDNHEVHSLRGSHFTSLQFHPESMLTRNGVDIIAKSIKEVLKQ